MLAPVPHRRLALSVLFVALLGAVDAQPRDYNPTPLEADPDDERGRKLGWQRFYSRTHSHEEEYDTTYAWRGTGPGMSRGADGRMSISTEIVELPGARGAWSGGDVRLDRTNHKWGDYVRTNCTDPNGEGIETLASGVQYRVTLNGTGTEHPKDDSPCNIHYEARKDIDGEVCTGGTAPPCRPHDSSLPPLSPPPRIRIRMRACPSVSSARRCLTRRTTGASARLWSLPASRKRRGAKCC